MYHRLGKIVGNKRAKAVKAGKKVCPCNYCNLYIKSIIAGD